MIDWYELVEREGNSVWRTIHRLVRNHADADECFQETFMAAYRLSQREKIANWPPLLQRLAIARAIDRLRQRSSRSRREDPIDAAQAVTHRPDASARLELEERAQAFRWALAQLPAEQAELFCLHELEGWSCQQVGDQFSMSTGAVAAQLHRTRGKLKQMLEPKLHPQS